MPLYKFKESDIFVNRIKAHPKYKFHVYNSNVYINNTPHRSGSFTGSLLHVPHGHISLYEYNVDRPTGNKIVDGSNHIIYPFLTKEGSLTTFSTISTSQFNSDFSYGNKITSSYRMSASITREYQSASSARPHIKALKTTFDHYQKWSRHLAYSSSEHGDKSDQILSLISIPSIFFGSSIKKGSMRLKYYITGTLVGEAQDLYKNGELIQTGPSGSTGSGSVAGCVLYNEGFLIMTASWDLDSNHAGQVYLNDGSVRNNAWIYYGTGMNDGTPDGLIPSASFVLEFSGTSYVPTITMLAHAPRGELIHSNNPTYVKYAQSQSLKQRTGSFIYHEHEKVEIKNTVTSSYLTPTASFQKQTWISKIGIYDEERNLIAIAKLANPVKKTADRDFTFKLKLDI